MSYLGRYSLSDPNYSGAYPTVTLTVDSDSLQTIVLTPAQRTFEFQVAVAWTPSLQQIPLTSTLQFLDLKLNGTTVLVDLPKCNETLSVDLCASAGCTLCPLLECRDSSDECEALEAPIVRVAPAGTEAVLSWNAIVGMNYRIYDKTSTIANLTSSDGAKYVLSSLSPSTEYTFFIQSVKDGFQSDMAPVNFTTLAIPSDPPTGLVIVKTLHNQISLSWNASISPEVVEYWIELTSSSYRFAISTSGTSVSVDAVPRTTFLIRVVSFNGELFSTSALESSVTTPSAPISKPFLPTIERVTQTALEFTQLNPDKHGVNYDVNDVNGTCVICDGSFPPFATFLTSDVLTAGTEYELVTRLCQTAMDCSPSSEAVSFTTLINPPTSPVGLVLSFVSDSIVVMAWNKTMNTDYYAVTLKSSEDSTYESVFFTPETTATFREIPSETALIFIVTAVSSVGSSSSSSLSMSTLNMAPVISRIVASDPDDLDRTMSVGDVITTVFDTATNAPSCFKLICDTDISDLDGVGQWTYPNTHTFTITAVNNAATPLISLTQCYPDASCPVVRSSLNSPASNSKTVFSGSWGEQPSSLIITVDEQVVVKEDSTVTLLPTISSDTPIPSATTTRLTVSCTGDCYVTAAGQPWASSVTLIDEYETVYSLLEFGIQLQPMPHSTSSFRAEVNLVVAGIETESFTTVTVSPQPDAFCVAFPTSNSQISAIGGVFLQDVTITDLDFTGSYKLVAQVDSSATLILEPSECPSGVVMVSQIIAIAHGPLGHIECVLSKLQMIPSDTAISSGMVEAQVNLVDVDANEAYLEGAQVSGTVVVSVSCVGLEGGHLVSASIDTDMTILLAFDRAVSSNFVYAPSEDVFAQATVVLLGTGSYVLATSEGFRLFPGSGAVFVVSSPITILDNVFFTCPGESFATGSVELLPPSVTFSPVVSFIGPSELPVCNDGLELFVTASGMAGRASIFALTCDSVSVLSKATVSADGVIRVPSEALLPGKDTKIFFFVFIICCSFIFAFLSLSR